MFQLWGEDFILVRVVGGGCRVVSGGWISWNYNQLSQAKAEAETEFGNYLQHTAIPRQIQLTDNYRSE